MSSAISKNAGMALLTRGAGNELLSEPETERDTSLTREVAFVTAAALLYFGVRYITQGTADDAIANARRLLNIEALFSLDLEADIQSWALTRSSITSAANVIYMWLHWPVILGVLILSYRHWPQSFRRLRNAMIISGLVGLVIFAAFPVAPPRLLPTGSFVDTITQTSSTYRRLQPPSLVNEYAAVPSFHVGWNVLLVVALRPHLPKMLRLVAWISPIAMTVAVIITANHYLIDAVIGVALVFAAWIAAGYLPSSAAEPVAVELQPSARS